MTNRHSLLIASLLALAGVAQAQDVGQHPAVFSARKLPGVDPSTFIVQHPASLSWRAGHANHEHPAVAQKAESGLISVDANTFIVQPPAHVDWLEIRSTPIAAMPGATLR